MRNLLICAALCGLWTAQAAANDPPATKQQPAGHPASQHAAGQTSVPRDQASTEHSPGNQPHQQAQTAEHSDSQHPSDPNYRRHNGRWWYWQNDAWLMWSGDRWLNASQRQRSYSNAPRRSYSYMQENAEGYVPTQAGMPSSDASGMQRSFRSPYRVEFQKVLPSFGLRSAGSKVLGEY